MIRPGREKLNGKVEVDDAFIGGPGIGGKCGRGAENKVLNVVAIEVNDTNYKEIKRKSG